MYIIHYDISMNKYIYKDFITIRTKIMDKHGLIFGKQ